MGRAGRAATAALLVAGLLAHGAAYAADDTPIPTAGEAPAETAGFFRQGLRYTFRTYPRRVVETGVEAFTGRSLVILALAGATVPLLAEHVDGDVKDEIGRHPRRHYYVDVSEIAGSTGVLLLLPTAGLIGGHLFGSGETVRTSTTLLEALTVDGLVNQALKASTHRLRPDRTDYLSFPSGHASATFAVATVLASRYGWWVGVPAYAAATAIAASRIEADRHFFSDVVFGATLGTVVGLSALEVRDDEAAAGRRWTVAPVPLPHGFGLAVTTAW